MTLLEELNNLTKQVLYSHKSSQLNMGLNLNNVGFVGALNNAGGFSPIDDTNLKAYYKFNEASGNIINNSIDATKIANSDLAVTGATYIPSGGTSPFGYALSLDGVNDVAVASSSLASAWGFLNKSGEAWTICFWIYRDGSGTTDDLFATTNFNAGETGLLLRFNSGATTMSIYYGKNGTDRIDYTTTHTVSTGAWHFIYISYNDATGDLIFNVDNGVRETSGSHNLTNTTNPETFLSVGDDSAGSGFFAGDICELSIWNRVLSTDEEAVLYNSGSGRAIY